jgi:hypothetical protein
MNAPSKYGDTCRVCREVTEPIGTESNGGRLVAYYRHCGEVWTRGYSR